MDINESLQPVVAGIINNLKASIESELRAQISNEVINKIATTEFDNIVTNLVEQQTRSRLEQYNFIGKSDEQLQKIVKQITDDINRTLATEANTKINNYLNQKLAQIDVNAVIGTIVENKLTNLLQTQKFPEQSIPHTSIDFSGLKITGDAINGGIIANFGSTGIEDRATFVQLTLMDHASAFEGPLYAPELNVKGNVTVDGTLVINGDLDPNTPAFVRLIDRASDAVKLKLDGDFFTDYSDIIFNRIRTDGIDLDTITQGGKDIVKGNQLGYHITDTNIRRLGLVNDLQTSGENLLSDTLYVTKKRVGVNTMDPSAVLSIWDEEIEINVSKRGQDTGYISTPRYQKLILGANGKENLKLLVDGSIQSDVVTIGTVQMSSASSIPNYPGIAGQIVWNSAPGHGSAVGWVCLGATLWAKIGTID
jgi:hypothetical protein